MQINLKNEEGKKIFKGKETTDGTFLTPSLHNQLQIHSKF